MQHSLLKTLSQHPIIFVGGKGGVGKTTVSAALAAHLAGEGRNTLIISTDPAHSLGDVFKTTLNNQPIKLTKNLSALELNPDNIVAAHFAQVEKTIASYTQPEMLPKIVAHLQLAKQAPGAQEAAMLEAICHHLVGFSQQYHHIIFDTAPTGHTLRLLTLPEMMNAWTQGLLASQRKQAKLQQAAANLTPTETHDNSNQSLRFNMPQTDKWQQAVAKLEQRQALFAKAGKLLHDATQTAIVFVLTPDNLPILETTRALTQLKEAKLPCVGLVINQVIAQQQNDAFWQQRAGRQGELLQQINQQFAHLPQLVLPLQQQDVRGVDALADLLCPYAE